MNPCPRNLAGSAFVLLLICLAHAEDSEKPKRDLSRHSIASFPVGSWTTTRVTEFVNGEKKSEFINTYVLREINEKDCVVAVMDGEVDSSKQSSRMRLALVEPLCHPCLEGSSAEILEAPKLTGKEVIKVGTEEFDCNVYEGKGTGGKIKLHVSKTGQLIRSSLAGNDGKEYKINKLMQTGTRLKVGGKDLKCDYYEERGSSWLIKTWHCWKIPMSIAKTEQEMEKGRRTVIEAVRWGRKNSESE